MSAEVKIDPKDIATPLGANRLGGNTKKTVNLRNLDECTNCDAGRFPMFLPFGDGFFCWSLPWSKFSGAVAFGCNSRAVTMTSPKTMFRVIQLTVQLGRISGGQDEEVHLRRFYLLVRSWELHLFRNLQNCMIGLVRIIDLKQVCVWIMKFATCWLQVRFVHPSFRSLAQVRMA